MNLFKDYIIHECKCIRGYCDEWDTTLDCEFIIANPESFTLYGKTFNIDRIYIEPLYCGLNQSYTTIGDICCLKFGTADRERFELVSIPNEFVLEIADIFKELEIKKDKRLNDCIISDSFYDYVGEDLEE